LGGAFSFGQNSSACDHHGRGRFSLETTMIQLFLLSLLMCAAMAFAETPMRHSQTGEVLIHGPVEKVFSLFTPKGELLWIPTWKYTPVYPTSGETEQDMVFRTDDGNTTWSLARFDPPRTSVYVLMNDDVVARIEVNCRAESTKETTMRITYTWTALTEKGRQQLSSPEQFQAKMSRWKGWLDEYAVKQGWNE
jgi:hypothetical protein